MTQGLLPFQYESKAGEAGLTGLAGLPLYLELWRAAGLEQTVAAMSKRAPDYRFLAIREPLRELDLGDAEQLPFPTMSFGTLGRYKLFGLVTNRTLPGDELFLGLGHDHGVVKFASRFIFEMAAPDQRAPKALTEIWRWLGPSWVCSRGIGKHHGS